MAREAPRVFESRAALIDASGNLFVTDQTDLLEKKNLVAEQPAVADRLHALLAAHPEASPIVQPAQPTAPKK